MTITGQLPLDEQVAASLLRLGGDTRAARLFHDLPSARSLAGLADALGVEPDERDARLRRVRESAACALIRGTELSLEPVPSGRADYPPLLTHIPDPPIVLWRKGADVLHLPAIAIVGSRQPSPAGRAVATHLAQGLAAAGLTVVSGLARGVDAAAHEGALRAGGRSVAVLGSGLDVIYPFENRDLADRLSVAGCLVSEFPPGTRPLARHFPLRNRIISGLSLAVVVVEAAERSGSLITAKAALEQGRTVCAVPGGVASGCHRGCHLLIKDGAALVETVEDILAELSWRPRGGAVRSHTDKSLETSELHDILPRGQPVGLDELSQRTGRPADVLLAQLGQLEIDGKVERTGGGAYLRLD